MQVSVVQRQTVGGGEGSRDVDEATQVVVGETDVSSNVVGCCLLGKNMDGLIK